MGILIDRVRINNFRSLKDVEISLSPLTLLVGANNSGKTSFLRALSLALGTDRRFVTTDDLFIDQNGKTLSEKIITIDIRVIPVDGKFQWMNDFDDEWAGIFGDYSNNDPITGNRFFAFRTEITLKDDPDIKKFVIREWKNPNISDADKLNAKLDEMPLFFMDAQRDMQADLRDRSSYFGKLAKQINFGDERADIEAQLNELNKKTVESSDVLDHLKGKLEELNATVQSSGRGVEITPFPKKIRDLHKGLNIHFQDNKSESFPLEYHGMGTRSWASLLVFKAFVAWEENDKNPNKKTTYYPILALEEPEAHLHPNAQRQLYQQLKFINGQKIISTHSPYIAGQCELNEIRHFYKETDETGVNAVDLSKFTEEDIRKIRREVMNTRGEMLFAKGIILSEGETEEQALPIFAHKYWGKYPFELGLNFIGCGGNNYKGFLNLIKTLDIKWFIFSDYDNDAVKSDIISALKSIGISDLKKQDNIVLLYESFESCLISMGYENELKEAVIKFEKPVYHSEQHKKAKEREVNERNEKILEWSDEELLAYLEKWKTKIAPIYAEIIANSDDKTRRFPPKIKELFEAISLKFNLKMDKDNEPETV